MNLTYNNSVDILLTSVKEFQESKFYSEDTKEFPYSVYADLTHFFINSYRNNEKELLQKIIKFIDDCYSKGDIDLQTLIAVEFFEILCEKLNFKEFNDLLENLLTPNLRKGLIKMESAFNRQDEQVSVEV